MTRALLVWSILQCARAACVAVEGERITGADLARALPSFAAVPAAASFGFTPSPGVKRVFSTGEIARIARRHGVEATSAPVCFEYRTEPATAERFLIAIREALRDPEVSIEVIDYGRAPVPPGAIEFPRSGLTGRDLTPSLWRGRIRYQPTRSLPIWVKVRLSAERTVVVAAENLAPGKPISEAAVRIEKVRVHPFAPAALAAVEAAMGRLPRRTIAKGLPVVAGDLSEAPDVSRGDRIVVEVSSGSALLKFEGVAESGGRAGDFIMMKNVDSGKRFRARVVRKGVVAVGAAS